MDRMTRNLSQEIFNNQGKADYSEADVRRTTRRNNYSNNTSCACAGSAGDHGLLRKIQEVDFAIYEVVLYLDAYPHSAEALAHYHKLMHTRKALIDEYQAKVGPMTMFGNKSESSWDWSATPWPWE